MISALLASLLLVTPAPVGAQARATAMTVAAAMLKGDDARAMRDALAAIAPAEVRSEPDFDPLMWAFEMLDSELRTGHAPNDVWKALCRYPGDGASWVWTGGTTFDLATSDRSGLLERALDGETCAVSLMQEGLDWPAAMASTFWDCCDGADANTIASARTALREIEDRLKRRDAAPTQRWAQATAEARASLDEAVRACEEACDGRRAK